MSNRLMLGLWQYIIKVPPFLWQKQIAKGKRRFEKEYGSLSDDYRLPVDGVKTALDYLEKRMTFLYRNKNGEVVWAYPVTVDKTPHKITFNTGEQLYAA